VAAAASCGAQNPMPTALPSRFSHFEFWIVVLLTYGLQVAAATYGLYSHGFRPEILMTDRRLLELVIAELILAGLLGAFLFRRGWRLRHFQFRFNALQTLVGVGLFFATILAYYAFALFALLLPSIQDAVRGISFHNEVTFPIALVLVLINPAFEEFLNLGYVQQRLAGQGPVMAIGIAVLLRLMTHAYQGAVALISIIPVGVVFGCYFWYRQRLYPIVVAHALMDFLALLSRS
jgi:uncharacterized protein